MTKLKLGPIVDDKPVKLTIELPATIHRDLTAYAAALAAETGGDAASPEKLVAPMIERFMATDRGFAKYRRAAKSASTHPETGDDARPPRP